MKRYVVLFWSALLVCTSNCLKAAPPRSANLSTREWEDTFQKERAARKAIDKAVKKAMNQARREAEANHAADNLARSNAFSANRAAQRAHYYQTVGRAYAEANAAATQARQRLAPRPGETSRPIVRKEEEEAFVPMNTTADEMLTALNGPLEITSDKEKSVLPSGPALMGNRIIDRSDLTDDGHASPMQGTVVYGYGFDGADNRSVGDKIEDWMHEKLPEAVLSNKYYGYAEDAIRQITAFNFGKTLDKFKSDVTDRALSSLYRSGKNALPGYARGPLEAGETSMEMNGKIMRFLTDRETLSTVAAAAANLNDAKRKKYEDDFHATTKDLSEDAHRKASAMAGVPLPSSKDMTPERVTRNAGKPIVRQGRDALRDKGGKWIEDALMKHSSE